MYLCLCSFFFFKQKTAYEMRISDWSSDVCSSDLDRVRGLVLLRHLERGGHQHRQRADILDQRRRETDRGGEHDELGADPLDAARDQGLRAFDHPRSLHQIGRAHVWTPVTNAQLVCRLLLENKKTNYKDNLY